MSNFSKQIRRLSPVQMILLYYFIAVAFSTALLCMPVAYQPGVHIAFIDKLFVAVSALSVTGLTPISIASSLSTTGIFFLALILQLGAVGIMAIGTSIWLLLGKKIGFKERRLIMTDQNQTKFEGMVRLIKQIIVVVFVIEFIAFVVLGTYFLKYYAPGKAYLNGFFSTISAISNGGFDITGDSLISYQHDYFIQFITMLLIIFGAIGFPVLIEVKEYLFSKNNTFRRFSLFTKVTSITFFILIVVGALLIYLLDAKHFFAGKSWHEVLFYALFQSVTTRSAGLTTMDITQLTEPNHLVMSLLMFIGASPSSAGGGVRTTTFALVVIFIITYARGGNNIRIFRREVHEEDLYKAVVVMLLAIMIVYISTITISAIESISVTTAFFEATSAFGTVGLSLGVTPQLGIVSKLILMLLMFIGRVGIITALFMFKRNRGGGKYHYPKERIIIG
ncbi:TrkH family potassium uptake protein [Virgibacillus halophilus]|uniref:TrkH family potassium uptake protein n=1 Tax=Tigheibacillus halophilus TaxID=361280 RepID=UPI003631C420